MNTKTPKTLTIFLLHGIIFSFSYTGFAQQELKSIDEVIDGIDSLLGDIQPVPPTPQTRLKPNPVPFEYQATDDDSVPFRVNNELMPDMSEPKKKR